MFLKVLLRSNSCICGGDFFFIRGRKGFVKITSKIFSMDKVCYNFNVDLMIVGGRV